MWPVPWRRRPAPSPRPRAVPSRLKTLQRSRLRASGDPIQMMAADALAASAAETERLRERVAKLEAVARLNLETILAMQIAATEVARKQALEAMRAGGARELRTRRR